MTTTWVTGSSTLLLDDHHAVPRRITATFHHVGGEPGVLVELAIEVDERGAPHCLGLELKHYEDTPIRSGMLRFPLERLLRDAVASAAVALDELPAGGYRTVGLKRAERDKVKDGARRPRRGSPLTDENLQRAAKLYREAMERGQPPTRSIAMLSHVDRATARRWVAKAVERGLLDQNERLRRGNRKPD